MRTLRPGCWYLMYVCVTCKTKQVLFPDLSDGKAEINAIYHVACPQCGHPGSYEPEQMERYYHPESKPPFKFAR
jgi:DNA-directed RNA polymerase subunit RPC12/RpoP